MADHLRDRLRRLGVKQGREGGAESPPRAKPTARAASEYPIEALAAGREVHTDLGAYFVVEAAYPLDHRHGSRPLADLLRCDPRVAARLSLDETFANLQMPGIAFLDIETTGLAGGAGTLAFLIGLGAIEDSRFVLRQFFLRDPAEENALLLGLAESLKNRAGLITFNGRAFDVPIIGTRYSLARYPFDPAGLPHLDLLLPARQLWRGRFENCSLGTLETAVLGLRRTEADVPGWMIPQMYVDYLRTGDAREMRRVLYHNAEDVLSMVALAAHILETFGEPLAEARTGMDCLRLALWHDHLGRADEAEAMYRAAMARGLPDEHNKTLYERYGAFLRRAGRRAEAVPLWQRWAEAAPDDPTPCIETAKYYEWEARELSSALDWAGRALVCLARWPDGWRRDEEWQAVQHRLERLKRKLETAGG